MASINHFIDINLILRRDKMSLRIKAIFYLEGNHCITEAITYVPKDETVTEDAFKVEVEDIATDMKNALDEGVYSNSTKNFHFGDTTIRISALNAYQIFIEDVEAEGFNSPIAID
jgi:hypothetical protein